MQPTVIGEFTFQDGSTAPVVEVKRGLGVNVKQEHIDKGIRQDAKQCAIALAGGAGFWIYHHILYVDTYIAGIGRALARMKADKRTAKFIEDFDNGRHVEPGLYHFRPVSRSNSLITKRKENEKRRSQNKITALLGTRITTKQRKTKNTNTRSGTGYVKFTSKKKNS